MTDTGGQTDWPAQGSRLGAIPAFPKPVPLQDPIVLWDTRAWDGGDTLENLGSGGSAFDLTFEGGGGNIDGSLDVNDSYYFANFAKKLSWFSQPDVGAAPYPADWDDLGGDPRNGGFTYIIALGEIDVGSDTPEGPFLSSSDQSVEADVLFDRISGGTPGLYMNAQGVYFVEAYQDEIESQPIFGNFHTFFFSEASEFWGPENTDYQGRYAQLNCTMVTMSYDPMTKRTQLWLGRELMKQQFMVSPNPNPIDPHGDDIQWDTPGGNAPVLEEFDTADVVERMFLYLGFQQMLNKVWTVGTSWQPVRGAAFFRGTPKQADIDEWADYFYPADQLVQPYVETASFHRDDLDFDEAHSADFEVPDGVELVRFQFQSSSGGFDAEYLSFLHFDVACSPGDIFTFELGGGGQAGGHLGTGQGGWPDGGQAGSAHDDGSQTTVYADRYGGGGGGSTRIYLNSVLIAHFGGGGGGAGFQLAPLFVTASGDTDGGGPGEPINSLDGRDGEETAGGDTHGGQGAATTAVGAGGTPGGGAGSGNVGGTGDDFSFQVPDFHKTGGGGGGGGVFGGGGGGYKLNPDFESGGGGGGSSWIDTGVLSNLRRDGFPFSRSSGHGVAAFVELFWDPPPYETSCDGQADWRDSGF